MSSHPKSDARVYVSSPGTLRASDLVQTAISGWALFGCFAIFLWTCGAERLSDVPTILATIIDPRAFRWGDLQLWRLAILCGALFSVSRYFARQSRPLPSVAASEVGSEAGMAGQRLASPGAP